MKKIIFTILICASLTNVSYARVVGGNTIMDQDMAQNLCALTFDDGPSRNTAALLDMLNSYEIKATFFLLGQQVLHNPDMAKRIEAEGHEIGNHSWSHPNLKTLSADAQKEELESTDELLRSLGITPLLMRPPYGSFDERTVQIADELGIDVILWSLDSRDWKSLPSDYSKLRSTRGTVYEDGDLRGIFLFHDTHKTTVEDLPRIIANLRAGGCDKFVTVSEYLEGILDQEPPLLMSRHTPPAAPKFSTPQAPVVAPAPPMPAYAAGSGDLPMARCSRPSTLKKPEAKEETLNLDDAHAAAPAVTGGL